jgi:hypothetical protein
MEVNYIVAFIMLVITFYFSIGSTLYMFWRPIHQPEDDEIRTRDETLDVHMVDLELVSRTPHPD